MVGLSVALLTLAPSAIFVSPMGNDNAPGTAEQPLKSVQAAVELARFAGVRKIFVNTGEYELTRPIELDHRDNGLIIEAARGARPLITGAVKVEAGQVSRDRSSAENQVKALNPRAELHTLEARKLGLDALTPFVPFGFTRPIAPGPTEVFLGDQPLRIARWPNEGFATISSVREPGNGEADRNQAPRKPIFSTSDSRPRRWANLKDAWLYGYWKFDWADESIQIGNINASTGEITLATPHNYGVDKAAKFYAVNVREELDAVGEYFVDSSSGIISFVALPLGSQEIRVSRLAQPLLNIKDAKYVTIRGLDFAYSRGDGAWLESTEKTTLVSCRFFNLGQRGAVIQGGKHSGLRACDLWNTAEGGVVLGGGDRQKLIPARNFVENCDIHHFQRRTATYRPAVAISGVGNRVKYSAMHDAPHSAIIFSGNDHLIERNEFYHTVTMTGDGGVVYTGRDWTARGTQINFNYFHDNVGQSKWEPAIYLDDLASGIRALGNVIERCHWGFLIGGGRDNVLQDNLIVDCKLGFHLDARGLGWAARSRPTMVERLEAVPYRDRVWTSRYPELKELLAKEPMAPSGNVLKGNQLVRSGALKQATAKEFERSARFERNAEAATIRDDEIRRRTRGIGLVLNGERKALVSQADRHPLP